MAHASRETAASTPPKQPPIDLTPFQEAVNESATRARGLWLGYISLVAYLFVSAGTVTHRDLLLESPVKLPLLDVDLPLLGFFTVAPILLLINHFYLLLQLMGLSRRVRKFNEAMATTNLDPSRRFVERRKLDSFVMVQLLGGTTEDRKGLTSIYLKWIVDITLVIAPILLLLSLQISFLPYHHEAITWLHRCALIMDLALLWLFWPAIRLGRWAPPTLDRSSVPALLTAVTVSFSILFATFPGETVHQTRSLAQFDCIIGVKFETRDEEEDVGETTCANGYGTLSEGLFFDHVDQSTSSRRSLFSSTLVLPDKTLIDVTKLGKIRLPL